ncbi:MAG TPA: hypothetical protein PKK96_14110 [Anaerolineales bacterium]|nr:hypothetical protein [Anaerolineales bacterium]HMS00084.1 hypothetical protein [Anaerolineales bacterium]HNQ94364.1 hypothetical protein [Anaerolineales bacterium]HNS62135.1 hypothetical protein [Anaerolineales bacterium]
MTMKILFKKTMLLVLVAVLGMGSLSVFSVSAAGSYDPTTPPQGEMTNERLEQIWAKQLRAYEILSKTEEFIGKARQLIDRAAQNGKDISAVEAALDAFTDAAKDAKPVYESAQSIVDSHAGFDENGKVMDSEQAKETVHAMGEKLKEIKETMGGTGKALRDALHAFREANPRPEKTTIP